MVAARVCPGLTAKEEALLREQGALSLSSHLLTDHVGDAFRYAAMKTGRIPVVQGPPFQWRDEINIMMNQSNEERFRSFAERFVLARAPTFRDGKIEDDSWAAILDAKSIYAKIESVSKGFARNDEDGSAEQARANVGGFTGPIGPTGARGIPQQASQAPKRNPITNVELQQRAGSSRLRAELQKLKESGAKWIP